MIRWAGGVVSVGDLNVTRFAEALKDADFGARRATKRHGPSWSDRECHGYSRALNDSVRGVAFRTQKVLDVVRGRVVVFVMAVAFPEVEVSLDLIRPS